MQDERKTVEHLLWWLGGYVLVFAMAAWIAGKPAEILPVLTNLISGFAGAAFAIIRLATNNDDKGKGA